MKYVPFLNGLLGVAVLCLGACGKKENAEEGSGEEGGQNPVTEEKGYVLARANSIPPVGSKGAISGLMTLTEAPLSLKMGETPMVGTMSMKTEKQLAYEVVSETQVKVTVAKDEETQEMVINNLPQKRPAKVSPIQGKPLTFDLVDGTWVAKLDSEEELTEEEKEKTDSISEKLSSEESVGVYGSEPRKVGDTWEVDPNNIQGIGDDTKFVGTYQMTFDRLEEVDGFQCAVLVGKMNVVGTPEEGDAAGMEIKINAIATTFRSIEYLEDLKLKIEGEMTLSGSPQPGITMTVRGPLKMEQTSALTLP